MSSFSLDEVLQVTGGTLVSGSARRRIRRLCTDTRILRHGDFFVALRGSNFDGHRFLENAFMHGASGALIEKVQGRRARSRLRIGQSLQPTSQPLLIEVEDSLRAYQDLAAFHRKRFHIPVVAVTGSNGKTTTKEMVASTLKAQWQILSTKGNLNNSIGLPQTLLRLTARHQVAVVEMGVDQEGQTARLCEIARPTHGIITNIGPDHLEYFRTLDASARAKAELLASLPNDGVIVLNADDSYFKFLRSWAKCAVVSFGFSPKAHIRARDVRSLNSKSTFRVLYPNSTRSRLMSVGVRGVHNVSNALATLAVGHVLGVSARKMAFGLSRFRPAAMRSQVQTIHGVTLLHDYYNANPASMKVAINLLIDVAGEKRTIAILGDMLELGQSEKDLHRQIGEYVAEQGVDGLIACGAFAKDYVRGAKTKGMPAGQIVETRNIEEASRAGKGFVRPGDAVLIKGSRGMRMERLIGGLFKRET